MRNFVGTWVPFLKEYLSGNRMKEDHLKTLNYHAEEQTKTEFTKIKIFARLPLVI